VSACHTFGVGLQLSFLSLSFRLWNVDPSGKGSATRVLCLHSALFSKSTKSSRKSSMLYFKTSIHFFLCLSLHRCSRTFASRIRLTQSSSSRRCTCPNHFSLASRTLSVMHATPRMRRMSSFLFQSLKVSPRIQRCCKYRRHKYKYKFSKQTIKYCDKLRFIKLHIFQKQPKKSDFVVS